MLIVQIPLYLSRHLSLSSTVLGRSSTHHQASRRADECKSLLGGKHWYVHESEPTGEPDLCVLTYFSISA